MHGFVFLSCMVTSLTVAIEGIFVTSIERRGISHKHLHLISTSSNSHMGCFMIKYWADVSSFWILEIKQNFHANQWHCRLFFNGFECLEYREQCKFYNLLSSNTVL